jgi:hypothetical protein
MPTAHTALQVTHIISSSFFPQPPYWVNDVAADAEILAQSGMRYYRTSKNNKYKRVDAFGLPCCDYVSSQ